MRLAGHCYTTKKWLPRFMGTNYIHNLLEDNTGELWTIMMDKWRECVKKADGQTGGWHRWGEVRWGVVRCGGEFWWPQRIRFCTYKSVNSVFWKTYFWAKCRTECTCVRVCTCVCVCMCECVNVAHACVNVWMWCVRACMHMCVCVCLYGMWRSVVWYVCCMCVCVVCLCVVCCVLSVCVWCGVVWCGVVWCGVV